MNDVNDGAFPKENGVVVKTILSHVEKTLDKLENSNKKEFNEIWKFAREVEKTGCVVCKSNTKEISNLWEALGKMETIFATKVEEIVKTQRGISRHLWVMIGGNGFLTAICLYMIYLISRYFGTAKAVASTITGSGS